MAVLKLPRMPDGAAIVNTQNGKPITALTRAWNSAMTQIESSVTDIQAAIDAADAAQSDADAAMAAAIAAQADADAAMAAAVAAQSTADAAKATADALDAALNVTAGKVLTVLNTMTLAAIDGSTLNIGAGGTLGTAAFTNATDYLPSGTSLAFLPIAGGTITGSLTVNGHTTFEGVTSTGATGTGRLVYATSPTLGGSSGVQALILLNSGASPLGLTVQYTGASPNNSGAHFFECIDTGGNRMFVSSHGGIANYSAFDSNLCDESVKGAIERYTDIQLDALERSFLKVNWGRFKYLDQPDDDWNHGYTAQGVEAAFAGVAPELVDETDLGPKDGAKRKGVYDSDLTHIGLALLARGLKRIEAMEGKMYAAGIT